MTIGVAMIVKNESAMLARCLDSVKGADAIFIADTGSIDNTVEIAQKYTDKVYTDFVWCDSFAKARNFIREKATTDWILSIDADEICHDFSKVREAVELAEVKGALAVNVKMIAEDNGQFFYFPRLFKKSDQVWWEGAIHNHISVIGADIGSVEITHGYSPAHLLDRDRAFRILKKEVEATGNAREMFYLGREYWYKKEYDNCLKTLGAYVQKSHYLAEKADAFLIMARCYWQLGMANDARDACAQALICNSNFREAARFMAIISGKGSGNPRWEANARQWDRLADSADNNDVLFIRGN